jgi:hypothetical protein
MYKLQLANTYDLRFRGYVEPYMNNGRMFFFWGYACNHVVKPCRYIYPKIKIVDENSIHFFSSQLVKSLKCIITPKLESLNFNIKGILWFLESIEWCLYRHDNFLLCNRFPYGFCIGYMYCENLEFKKSHAKLFTWIVGKSH